MTKPDRLLVGRNGPVTRPEGGGDWDWRDNRYMGCSFEQISAWSGPFTKYVPDEEVEILRATLERVEKLFRDPASIAAGRLRAALAGGQ